MTRGVQHLLKIKNHVHLQHTMITPYIQVFVLFFVVGWCVCVCVWEIKRYTYNFIDKNTSDNIYM